MLEYEDCVIDVSPNRLHYYMPTWPTLWPGIMDGKSNIVIPSRLGTPIIEENKVEEPGMEFTGLSERQKQLLYECEEERMVVKACFRDLIKLKRSPKHTSWDTAEAANMAFM